MLRNGLDEFDQQIIAALKEDGRMPLAEIARRLDVSPGMVRERYNCLVESGILQVVAVTNPHLIGYRMTTLIGIKVDGGRLYALEGIRDTETFVYLDIVKKVYA
jgi:Lrp/AsnC family transcriptional regulator for asnA, asnC and gidA